MGHFLHRPECRSWLYAARCRDCANPIYVYQCSCGSGVAFETNLPPWPLHNCEQAILKGLMKGPGAWLKLGRTSAATHGTPLEVLSGFVATGTGEETGFTEDGQEFESSPVVGPTIFDVKAMDPMPGEVETFIGVVREVEKETARLKDLYASLGDIGRKLFGLPARSKAIQLTVWRNDDSPVESYTAIVDRDLAVGLERGGAVWLQIVAKDHAGTSAWVVSAIHAL